MTDRVRSLFGHLRQDLSAGAVLGIESVPTVSRPGCWPGSIRRRRLWVHGRHRCGRPTTSSAFMAVQGTGRDGDHRRRRHSRTRRLHPVARIVHTLSLTGMVMVDAGMLRLGAVLRFVSNAVIVGFINAVGVNIVLGHWPTSPDTAPMEGHASPAPRHLASSRSARLEHRSSSVWHHRADRGARAHPARPAGLVVAVVVTSAVATVSLDTSRPSSDLGATLGSLPRPVLPESRSCRAAAAGTLIRIGRTRARRRDLGRLPERGRHVPGRLPRLRWPGRRQRRVRRSKACRSAVPCPPPR